MRKIKLPINLVVFVGGLAMLAGGICMIYYPAAFIVVGIVLMVVSLAGGEK